MKNITVFVWTRYEYSKLFKSFGKGFWRDEGTQRYFKRCLVSSNWQWKISWSIEALKFYYENNIKIIDWTPYSPDLNPIENIWAIMKRKIAWKTFTTINSLKNELYTIWRELDHEMIMNTWMSIYDKMNDCIEAKGCLTNHKFYIYFINII